MGASSPNFASLAVDAASLPLRLGIDWSYEMRLVEQDLLANSHMTVEEAIIYIAHKYGSVASYDAIRPDLLRVFCTGDPPANPRYWQRLTDVRPEQIVRHP
jgi:hypothetical protein